MSHSPTRRSFLLLGGAALASGLAACTRKTSGSGTAAASSAGASGSSAAATATTTPSPTPTPTNPVHVSIFINDGGTYGVGMPIIARFDVAPTDSKAFNKATKVTVNGSPVQGNWYFEPSSYTGSVMEAHWRPETYWPAHAKVHMDLPVKGLSAGVGLSYDDSLTSDFTTGVAYIGTIDATTLMMTVTADGAPFGVFPVSLGAPDTPTATGTKVIMDKGLDIRMTGPGYDDPHVKFTQRLTYGGEYLHAAPWNIGNLGRADSSNGCTNLLPADAERLYNTFEIGDVFIYPNADGPAMTLGEGYGDWNLTWDQWKSGGSLPA